MKNLYLLYPLLLFVFITCEEETGINDGIDGFSTLFLNEDEPSGVNCQNGGTKISYGVDSNENDSLDIVEITNTFYLCDGENGVANMSSEIIEIDYNDYYSDNYYNNNFYCENDIAYFDYHTPLIDQGVLDSGLVFVQSSPDSTVWNNLPYNFYFNEENYYLITNYLYSENKVTLYWQDDYVTEVLDWNCLGRWNRLNQYVTYYNYDKYFKIIVITSIND